MSHLCCVRYRTSYPRMTCKDETHNCDYFSWEKGKQPTFGDATSGFLAKSRLRNESRNSILMTRHYPDLGRASDWSCRVRNLIQPIRSTTQIWIVIIIIMEFLRSFLRRHLARKPVIASPNYRLFSQAILYSPFCIMCTAAPSPKKIVWERSLYTGYHFLKLYFSL